VYIRNVKISLKIYWFNSNNWKQ